MTEQELYGTVILHNDTGIPDVYLKIIRSTLLLIPRSPLA